MVKLIVLVKREKIAVSKIKDLKLAPSGEMKINWVERNMPVLRGIGEDFKKTRPFAGMKVALSVHLEAKTAYLCRVMEMGGAEMYVTGSNPLSTQDDVAAALAAGGMNVFAEYGCSMEQYEECLEEVLKVGPNIIIDDGGDLIQLLHGECREYGKTEMTVVPGNELFKGLPDAFVVWMSHGDRVAAIPEGFKVSATSANCPYAAVRHEGKQFFGIQFHPEVVHTECGLDILRNFCHGVCGCAGTWTMESFIEQATADIRRQVGGERVKVRASAIAWSAGADGKLGAVSEPCFFPHTLNMTFYCPQRHKQFFRNSGVRLTCDQFPQNLKLTVCKVFAEGVSQFKGRGGFGENCFSRHCPIQNGQDLLCFGALVPKAVHTDFVRPFDKAALRLTGNNNYLCVRKALFDFFGGVQAACVHSRTDIHQNDIHFIGTTAELSQRRTFYGLNMVILFAGVYVYFKKLSCHRIIFNNQNIYHRMSPLFFRTVSLRTNSG